VSVIRIMVLDSYGDHSPYQSYIGKGKEDHMHRSMPFHTQAASVQLPNLLQRTIVPDFTPPTNPNLSIASK
jgi:hypothetical protein